MPTRYGVEEPLTANDHVLAVNDASRKIELANFRIDGMSRYSLVWRTQEERARAEPHLISRLLKFGEASWILGWNHQKNGPYKIGNLRFLRKLQAAGWQTLAKENLGLGLRVVKEDDSLQQPPVHETLVSSWFLWFGPSPDILDLSRDPFEPTLRLFCKTRRLYPSQHFLLALRDRRSGLLYEASGGGDLPGMIVVVPVDRSMDVRTGLGIEENELSKSGDAYVVWEAE